MTRARALLLAAAGLALVIASPGEARVAEAAPEPSLRLLATKLAVAFIVAIGVVLGLCMIAACMRLTAEEKERAKREAERRPRWRTREDGEE